MNDMYLHTFNIYPALKPDRVLGFAALHEAETNINDHLLNMYHRDYLDYQIKQLWGYTFSEYMDLTYSYTKKLNMLSEEELQRRSLREQLLTENMGD